MPIGVGHCFAIFFVVIDVGANIFASMSMTWFVLGETGQGEELVLFSPVMIFIPLSERNMIIFGEKWRIAKEKRKKNAE